MPRLSPLLLIAGLLLPTLAWAQLGTATNRQGFKPPSAGLFVGVNDFTEDDTIQDLNYAVNDAIDLAHLFVIDLRMVPPENARLVLSGRPDEDDAARLHKLETLEKAGVVPREATKAKILKSLREVVEATKTPQETPDTLRSDFLVISISSHGFQEENGANYVIPQDGLLSDLVGMGIDLKASIESKINDAGASKKLILIDACRNEVEAEGDKGTTEGGATGRVVTQAFVEAFEEATGLMVFYSGSPTQVSYEDHTLKQGVFTHYLLRALGRESPITGNDDGIITLGDVVQYVREEVQQWAIAAQKLTVQVPFVGAGNASNIPILQYHREGILAVHEQWGGTHVFIDETLVAVLEGDPDEDDQQLSIPLPPGPHTLRLHLPPQIVESEFPSPIDTLRYIDFVDTVEVPPGDVVNVGADPFSNFGYLNLFVTAPDEPPDAQVFIAPDQAFIAPEALALPDSASTDEADLLTLALADQPLELLGEVPLGKAPIEGRPLPAGTYLIRIDGGPKYAPVIERIPIPPDEKIVPFGRMLDIVAPPRLPVVDTTFTGATITEVQVDSFRVLMRYNLVGLPTASTDLYNVELMYTTSGLAPRVASGASGHLGLQRVGDDKAITWAILNDVPNAHARRVEVSLKVEPQLGFWKSRRNIAFVAAGTAALARLVYLTVRTSDEQGLAGLPGLPPR